MKKIEANDVDIDDESYDALMEIIEKHAPDIHGCAKNELRRAIVDEWLPRCAVNPNTIALCSQAEEDVIVERRRQIDEEGFEKCDDDQHTNGELVSAALCYAWASFIDPARIEELAIKRGDRWWAYRFLATHFLATHWPWDRCWWKPSTGRRMLVKAAALLIAEIERIDRAEGRASS